ncbi:MAG: RNA methyltransferase [Flavobacteriales bacterium]|jgi:tRNA G18 (ribose-2'-O)-methylase SpoU|nr:RNA methyltransferase [Flavobacteriales bacterium]
MPADDRKLAPWEMGRVAPERYRELVRRPVRVVLDDVRSRHNVGSIFRTADAFGIEALVLCGLTPVPPHREIEKTALGATLSVPWTHATDALAAVRALQREGFRVWCVEQTVKAVPFHRAPLGTEGPIALVLGNELHGVGDALIAACDGCITVPQHGSKHSLNVAVCAGVVLWWAAGRAH